MPKEVSDLKKVKSMSPRITISKILIMGPAYPGVTPEKNSYILQNLSFKQYYSI